MSDPVKAARDRDASYGDHIPSNWVAQVDRRVLLAELEQLDQKTTSLAAEVKVLRSILKRTKSIMWWARLGYPDDLRYWTPEEAKVLEKIFNESHKN